MIDPRLIRPEAIAPSTDIVTPSPQYYGEGTVRGGQIQLGDVYGQRPRQSQEEYLFQNLASMAQSSMSMFTFPAQMEEAEQQRNNKHDQDKLFEYRTAYAALEQAQLNGEGVFEWGGTKHDINNPELLSALELQMQEEILGGMRTKAGIANAAEIKTASLEARNKSVDGRIAELAQEWETELARFESENLLLSPEKYYEAFRSDPRLLEKIQQILSYRNTRSPQMEAVLRSISAVENKAAGERSAYLVDVATEMMRDTTASLVDSLPGMVELLRGPFAPVATLRWLTEIENPEIIYQAIGLLQDEKGNWSIQSGSLLDSISSYQRPQDIRELIETVVSHSLQTNTAFRNDDDRTSYARKIVQQFNNEIVKISSTFRQMRANEAVAEMEIGLRAARNNYIEGRSENTPDIFAGKDSKETKGIIIGGLLNQNNTRKGIDRRNFVIRDAVDSIESNMGKPDIPLSQREQRLARAYLNVSDLVNTGLYEQREDGEIYLSDAGKKELQNRSNAVLREVFNDPVYMNLVKDELDSIQYSAKYLPGVQPSFEALQKELNKDLLGFVKTHFPTGKTTDKDLLIAMGLEDAPEGYAFPADLSKWIDDPVVRMFHGVVNTIFQDYGRSVSAAATEAAKIPDAFKPFATLNRQDVLDDNSVEAFYAAGEFNRKMSEARTDEERAKIIRDDYASQPWMTAPMMQNLVAKARQLDQKTDLAKYAMIRLNNGQLGPNEPVEISPLDFTEKLPIKNAAEFWTNPEYFNQETGRFTKRGAKLFALWSTSFFSGPISSTQREGMQQWMDEVVNTELSELGNPTSMLSGSPLLMLAEVVTLAESFTSKGIASFHQSHANKYPREVSYIDPQTGDTMVLDLSYSPEAAARVDNFMSIFGNPSERTTQLQLAFARQLAHQLRGVDGLDRSAVRDFVQRNAKIYTGLMTTGTRDLSNVASEILASAGPIGMRGNDAYYPGNSNDFVRVMLEAMAREDHSSVINGFVSMSNIMTSDKQAPIKINEDNRAKLTRDILVSSAMWSQSQGHQYYYQIPQRFANSYNAGISDPFFHIQAGDILPLWGNGDNEKNIMSILANMSDEYLKDDSWWWIAGQSVGARSKKDSPMEWNIVDGLLKNLLHGINVPVPGTLRPSLAAVLPTMMTLQQDNILDFPKNDSVLDRMRTLFKYFSFVDGHNNTNGYLPTLYQDYNGTKLGSTQRKTLPPAYHYQGSPIPLGWGSQIEVKNYDNEFVPLFKNKGNEIAAEFFLASPNTSTNKREFAEARMNYFIDELISPTVWDQFDSGLKDEITALSKKGDVSNITFFRAALNIADKSLPVPSPFFSSDFEGLVYNNALLPEQEFNRAWSQSGYYLMENGRNTHSGFFLNKNGHIMIGQNGRSPMIRIPLSPAIMRLIDVSTLGEVLITPETKEEPFTNFGVGGAGDKARGAGDRPLKKTKEKSLEEQQLEEQRLNEVHAEALKMSSNTTTKGPRGMAAQALGMAAVAYLPPNNKIASEIIGSEGFSSSPKKVDRKGDFFTVGHGHLLDGSERSRKAFKEAFPDKNYDEFMAGKGTLTKEEAFLLFEKDIPTYIERAKKFTNKHGGLKFEDHTEELQIQLISATYRGSWGKSPKARKYLSEGKYEEAAKEFLDNKEYKDAATDPRIFGIRARMEKVANAIRTEGERKKKLEEEKKKKEQAEKTK